ncbi:MAG: RimJ/RimL family protein N-acetyltransferase [Paraglaciecola sp.]|jgi:RimJ/RimL family protein N-acetyltransferase
MTLSGYQVILTEVCEDDIEFIRQWRNDPGVSQYMLSQQIISAEQQRAWFNKIQRDDSQQHFVIHYKEQAIGVANIRACYPGESLKTARAIEPGLYIATEKYRNNILAFAPTLVLNDYCFDDLPCTELIAVVKADNLAALNYNQKLGYRIEKHKEKTEALVEIRLNKADYQQHTVQLKALLCR